MHTHVYAVDDQSCVPKEEEVTTVSRQCEAVSACLRDDDADVTSFCVCGSM
jgi:hypothetical protein